MPLPTTQREIIETCAQLRGLLLHPGWKIFVDLLAEDREGMLASLLDKPMEGPDKIFLQEFVKGQSYQIKRFPLYAQELIDTLAQEINKSTEEEIEDAPLDDDDL